MWNGHGVGEPLPLAGGAAMGQGGAYSSNMASTSTLTANGHADDAYMDSYSDIGDTSTSSKPKKLKGPRTSLACDACRKTKVRCEGGSEKEGIPCTRCVSLGIPCQYNDKPQKKQPPSRAYVDALEKRLATLEAALAARPGDIQAADLTTDSRTDKSPSDQSASKPFTPFPPPEQPAASNASEKSPPNRVNSPLDGMDSIADRVDEINLVEDRFFGRSSGMLIAQMLVNNATSPTSGQAQHHELQVSVVESLMHEEMAARGNEIPVPPDDLGEKLVIAYFENINDRTLPLLHRPSFMRGVRSKLFRLDISFRSLYLSVCAMGARFVKDQRLQPPQHPLYNAHSLDYALGYDYWRGGLMCASPPFKTASLCDIQSLLLCSIYLLGAGNGMSAWTMIGYTMRRTIDIGMHRENRPRWRVSPLENELRKRAFFMLVLFDQFLSSSLGRPECMSDRDYDLKEPIVISDAALDEWELARSTSPPARQKVSETSAMTEENVMRGFLQLVSISRISARAMTRLFTERIEDAQSARNLISEVDVSLNGWLEQVPAFLRWKPAKMEPKWLAMSFNLYAVYYSCQLLIHRDFITPKRAALTTYPSLAICANAARSMTHLLDEMRKREQLELIIPIGCGAASQAVIMLMFHGLVEMQRSNQFTHSGAQDVKKGLDVLDTMGQFSFQARVLHRTVVPLCDALRVHILSKKRSHTDDSQDNTPTGSGQGSSPSNNSNHTSNQDEGEERATNRARKLPMTTNDLSLPTFRGRPTFAPAVVEPSQALPHEVLPPVSVPNATPFDERSAATYAVQSSLTSETDPAASWLEYMHHGDKTPGASHSFAPGPGPGPGPGRYDWSLPPLSPSRGFPGGGASEAGGGQTNFSPSSFWAAFNPNPDSSYGFPVTSGPPSLPHLQTAPTAPPAPSAPYQGQHQQHQQQQQHQQHPSFNGLHGSLSDIQDLDFNAILGSFTQGNGSWN